jgi:uncharacterized membrane protein
MTTEETTSDAADTGADDGQTVKESVSAEELAKWKQLARKHEEQAKKNADAAERLAELEKQQSDTGELSRQLEEARDAAGQKDLEIARLTAALNHGLSADDLDLLGTGTAEEITKRAERLAERLAPEPVVPSSVNQGGNGTAPQVSGEKLAEQIWSRNRI